MNKPKEMDPILRDWLDEDESFALRREHIEPSAMPYIEWAFELGKKSEQDRCCTLIFGHCDSDNVAQRTVDAIRGVKRKEK